MSENFDNSASAIIAAMRASGEVVQITDLPGIVFVPTADGYVPKDMRANLIHPVRSAGVALVFDPDTFIRQFVALGATPTASAVFIDSNPKAPAIEGIIDYDAPSAPGWRGHRVKMEFRATPEWDRFLAINEKPMGAMEFANFIEDNQSAFLKPEYGDLMQIVQNFEVDTAAKFSQAVRLDSGGVELTVLDNPSASIKGGKFQVPDSFTIALKPFQGASAYSIKAMFRWRQSGGDLRFFFKLLKLDDVVRDAVNDFVQQINDGLNLSVKVPESTDPATGVVTPAHTVPATFPYPIYSGIAPGPRSQVGNVR